MLVGNISQALFLTIPRPDASVRKHTGRKKTRLLLSFCTLQAANPFHSVTPPLRHSSPHIYATARPFLIFCIYFYRE